MLMARVLLALDQRRLHTESEIAARVQLLRFRRNERLADGYNEPKTYMRAVITERDVPLTGEMKIARGTIVTPSARDLAEARGVKLIEVPADQVVDPRGADRTIAIGSDHGGLGL